MDITHELNALDGVFANFSVGVVNEKELSGIPFIRINRIDFCGRR